MSLLPRPLKPSPSPHLEPLLVLVALEAKRQEIITEYLLLWLLLKTLHNPAEENGLNNDETRDRERSVKFTDPDGLQSLEVPAWAARLETSSDAAVANWARYKSKNSKTPSNVLEAEKSYLKFRISEEVAKLVLTQIRKRSTMSKT